MSKRDIDPKVSDVVEAFSPSLALKLGGLLTVLETVLNVLAKSDATETPRIGAEEMRERNLDPDGFHVVILAADGSTPRRCLFPTLVGDELDPEACFEGFYVGVLDGTRQSNASPQNLKRLAQAGIEGFGHNAAIVEVCEAFLRSEA